MITKPRDYEETTSFGVGRKSLPADGYVCRIINVEEKNDRNGNPMVHFAIDIIDGEYTNYFTNAFQDAKRASDHPLDVKYPFEGQMWVPVYDYFEQGKTNSKFKGLCTALEDSGTRVWDANGGFILGALMNAEIGIIFRREENENPNTGKRYWQCKPWMCRSVSAIEEGDFFVPDDKPIEDKPTTPYGQPSQPQSYGNNSLGDIPQEFSATSDDIPF